MKARLAIAAFVVATAITGGRSAADDAGVARAEVRWERPPAGSMERGAVSASESIVLVVGSIVIAGAAIALALAALRARRSAR